MSLSPVTFTRTTAGLYDPLTDTHAAPTVTTIPGKGAIVRSDPQRLQLLELIPSTSPTILFRPNVYGLRAFTPEFVLPGDVAVINGVKFVAKDISTTALDGIVVIGRVICSAGGE